MPVATDAKGQRGVVGEGSVRVGPLMALPQVLDELGADTDTLLVEQGFHRTDFEDPESVMPVHAIDRLLHRGAEVTACPQLGVLVGRRGSLSALGVLGFLMRASKTVGEALQILERHLQVQDRAAVVSFEVSGGQGRLGYALTVTGLKATDQTYGLVALIAIQIMRGLCGPGWRASEVHLPFRAPRDAAALREACESPLRFGTDRMVLVFPASDLARPVPTADPLLYRMMAERVSQLEAVAPRGLIDEVRQMLRALVLTTKCTPSLVARRVGIAARTLNRRLALEGTSLRALRDEVRRDTACQLLAQTAHSAADIGQLLGYAEPAAFTRAFKRWAGVGPAQWRAQQKGAASGPALAP
ncbi:MAG: AraC family transcriptional regulator [Rubrivivax sp.]|nr:AraC family transcriptional regulator [Rubrivivax sp.]